MKNSLVIDTIMFPVRYYDQTQQIFDAENNLVADVRGWGRISHLDRAEERQDAIGQFIADAMNEKIAGDANNT